MNPFTHEVVRILKEIPPGCVVTYGQVAAMAGNPKGARQVVRILHALSEIHQLPWHRVVNKNGEIKVPAEGAKNQQKKLLQQEGIKFTGSGQVDWQQFTEK